MRAAAWCGGTRFRRCNAIGLLLAAGWALPACGSAGGDGTGGTAGWGGSAGAGAGTGAAAGADGGAGAASTGGQAPTPLLGVYDVVGSDARWGAYTGRAEIRASLDDGALSVAHVQQWSDASFEGSAFGLAWEGTVEALTGSPGPYPVSFTLSPVGFIRSYGDDSRDGVEPTPLGYHASLVRTAPDTLAGSFVCDGCSAGDYQETWIWTDEPAAEPLWRNEREWIAMHDAPSADTLATLFTTYATFHALPDVAPYVSRPEFQAAIHYQAVDPTDFEFLRANPNTVRVIQKVPDVIALAEARKRAQGYGQTLAQKQAYYDSAMPARFLNSAGMLVTYDDALSPPAAWGSSGDSMLWTGVYVASQAMRYLVTGESAAADNLLRGLHGQLLCHEIVGQPGQFARTIREHTTPLDDWVQGTGAHTGFDWRPGCNNDMLQGYYVGFLWAYLALEQLGGHDAEKQQMVAILEDLVENNDDANDDRLNELKADMLLFLMTGDVQYWLSYEALFQATKEWLVDQGNGVMWQYGTSDWSGNHLIIQGLLVPWVVSQQLDDGHLDELETGLRNALERLRYTRLGLFQLVAGTLGDFPTPPPEVEESLWMLREFPAPKRRANIDRRIDPSFCMSPFPNLPWKADWTTADRLESLYAYPLFEKTPDVFAWKQGPFEFRDAASTIEDPGVDYLFAYWFGRYFGVIAGDA